MAIGLNSLSDQGLSQLAGMRVGAIPLQTSSLDLGAPQRGYAEGQIRRQQDQQKLNEQSLQNAGALGVARQQGVNQLANTGLEGQNSLASIGAQGQQTLANTQLQGQQQLANTQLLGQQQLQNTGMQGQNQLANTALSNQGQAQVQNSVNAISQAKNAAEAQYQQGQLGIQQQQADTEQAKQQQESTMQNLQATMMMKSTQIKTMGAAGSIIAMGLNQYQGNPQKQQEYLNSTIPTLVQEGILPQDEADKISQMTPDQVHQLALAHVLMAGYAGDAKSAGLSLPGSKALFGNIQPDQKNQTDLQNQAINSQRSQMDVGKMITSFDPSVFTGAGILQGKYGNYASMLPNAVQSVLPGMESSTDQAAKNAAYSSNTLQGIMDTLAQQKGVRFNKMTVDVLKPEIPEPGVDGPAQAFSKVVTLNQRMQRANEFADTLIKQGVSVDSKQYQSKMNDFLQTDSNTGTGKIPYTTSSGERTELGYNQINNLAQHNKMSFNETLNHILNQGNSNGQ